MTDPEQEANGDLDPAIVGEMRSTIAATGQLSDDGWQALEEFLRRSSEFNFSEDALGVLVALDSLLRREEAGLDPIQLLFALSYPGSLEDFIQRDADTNIERLRRLQTVYGSVAQRIVHIHLSGARNWDRILVEPIDAVQSLRRWRIRLHIERRDGFVADFEMPPASFIGLIARFVDGLGELPDAHRATLDDDDLQRLREIGDQLTTLNAELQPE